MPATGAAVDNRMQKLLLGCLFAVLLTSSWLGQALPLAAQASARYIAGVDDLPLMPGLEEMKESGLIFDKPSGRIVEAYAAGRVTPGEVLSFYERTLPELGWRSDRRGGYLREGERLQLTFTEASDSVTVQFRLYPE